MFLNRRYHTSDCNRCDTDCIINKNEKPLNDCTQHSVPKDGFMLAELTLVHATNLNKALSALPFDANLNFYLK